MRPFYLIAAVFAFLVLPLPALAQSAAKNEIAAVARVIDDLEARWEANRRSFNTTDLHAWAKRVLATGDVHVIFRFYRLFTAVAQRDGNRMQMGDGRLHVALARHTVNSALTLAAARANLELGHVLLSQDGNGFRDAGQFALMNALSVADALVRSSAPETEIINVQAMSNALLGQSFLQSGRPGAALYYLSLAAANADVAAFSERNKTGLNILVKQAQAGASAIPPLNADIACDEAAERDQQRRDACQSRADILWSRSDLAGAEDILSRLAGAVTCTSQGVAGLETVQRLMFLRALRERPGEPALRDAVCAVANRVAVTTPLAASVLAMPTIRASIDGGPYDSEVADLAAHISRRWILGSKDLLAWYFIEALTQLNEKAVPSGNLPPHSAPDQTRQQKLAQSLIALDRAYLAERNGWWAAGEIQRAQAIANADAYDVLEIERLLGDLQKYWRESYGFRTPTQSAAAEFYALVALRLPAGEQRRSEALTSWISLEHIHRADAARAERIATELIEQMRRDGRAERITLARLLSQYAAIVDHAKPEAADNALREALTIYIAEPGHETDRLKIMLSLEGYRGRLGDSAGADSFFTEAKVLRESAPSLEEIAVAEFDIRHAVRLTDQGQRTQALELAEEALRRLEAAKAGGWQLARPASILAKIYAQAGQIERAREIYSKHILPWAKAANVGVVNELRAHMTLAFVEAVYGPSAETVRRLRELLGTATRVASGARELQEAGWRGLAFANLGIGAHREALEAARRSSTLKPPQGAESEQREWERRLAETHVAAVWRVAR